MSNHKITVKNKKDAQKMLDAIPSVAGEKRAIYKCCDCGSLFGRRYIPYGIGQGARFNMCICQLTNRTPCKTVLEATP